MKPYWENYVNPKIVCELCVLKMCMVDVCAGSVQACGSQRKTAVISI